MTQDKVSKYKRVVMFLIGIVILGANTAIFGYVWYQFYSDAILLPFYRRGNWLVVGVYLVIYFLFSKIYGGLKVGNARISDIIYSQTLALLFTNAVTYAQISLIARHLLWPIPVIVMTVAQICLVVLWACGANWVYFHVFPARKMLLVYGSHSATRLALKMSKRSDKYLICAAVNAELGYDEVIKQVDKFPAIVICDVKGSLRNQILKYCYGKSIRVYITPKLSDIVIGGSEEIHLFDTPLFLCRNSGLSLDQQVAKRALDLICGVLAFIVASPFMLITAAAIKLYDGGPVLFKQKRLTIGGKEFNVYKFRSMVVDAEKDGVARLATQHDDRITPVGRIIRKIRFDELPQILNILKGDMSIVGPRPERPEIAEEYKKDMPEFDYRLKVKAGLTGYAQILGKYNTLPYDKLKLDLIYIENYSLLLDLKLILMTIKILFIPESTEGLADGEITPLDEAQKK